MDYTNNSINMGAMIGSQSKYNQETNTRNQGRHNQKTINHTPTGLDVISEIKNYSNTDGLYNRGTHRFYRNPMNDFNKQVCYFYNSIIIKSGWLVVEIQSIINLYYKGHGTISESNVSES